MAVYQVGHLCNSGDHGQVGNTVAHGSRGVAAHSPAQHRPAAVGLVLVPDTIGAAYVFVQVYRSIRLCPKPCKSAGPISM